MRPAGGVGSPPARRRLPRPPADFAPELHGWSLAVAQPRPSGRWSTATGPPGRRCSAAICSGRQPRRRQSLIASSLPLPRWPCRRLSCAWTRTRTESAQQRPGPRRRRGAALAVACAVPAAAVAAARPRRQARAGRDRSVPASTRSPRLDLGAVTNLCDDTSALTVEGDLPSSLASPCTRPRAPASSGPCPARAS